MPEPLWIFGTHHHHHDFGMMVPVWASVLEHFGLQDAFGGPTFLERNLKTDGGASQHELTKLETSRKKP